MSAQTLSVRHNPAGGRFEADVEGGTAHADYRMRGDVMQIVHTEVPVAAEGRGVAGQVVRAALAHARTHGLRVQPMCGYVRDYMQRHPETHDLLPTA
ncbi:MAG TPA: GNAT family N-acetyltransferase [Casimicrobiaceae bacterium]|nr:GNAT family N-acetyltransferase [Casimicrobiaceae bacterium]